MKKIILIIASGILFGTIGALVGDDIANKLSAILLLILGFLITAATILMKFDRE
jgi:hypothetical protein